ncbi:MAG TPA: secretin N-terminal domain-containing protein, partial [Longimicrobium sp.]|nr:secretin N-terminal domain-containing protein [Longimicrobium sp.]
MAVRAFSLAALCAALLCGAAPARAQTPAVSEGAGGVTVNLVNTELRAAVQALSQYLDRPVYFGSLGNTRVTFQSPAPVPRADIPRLLRGLLDDQGYDMEDADGAYRIRQRAQAPPAQPPPVIGGPPVARAPGGMELNVIHLRHARASDVSATINALYGRGGALGERGRSPGLSDQLRDNRIDPVGQPGAAPGQGPVSRGDLAGDLIIVPDSRTNSLLVRASAADFELIRAAVEQVDVRPLQVVIEATVAYIRRDYQFRLGVSGSTGDVRVPGTGNTTGGGGTTGGSTGDLVLRALNLGGIDLDLVLQAGESR